MKRLSLSCVVLVAACGCDAVRIVDDAGPDGGARMDAGTEPDAAQPDPDGGDRDDGGSPDAGPPDAGPPDAGRREPCDSPGAIESVPCGMCGTVDRFCSADGTWAYGACTGEGACMPGMTDSAVCGDCGTQARRCTVACAWEDDGACMGEGECTPGATTSSDVGCPAGQLRNLTCDAMCTFVPSSECSAEACPTPGAIEGVPCGMCGTQERFCTATRTWDYGACTGEGACVPGTTGSIACGMCGTQAARCDTTCAWVPVSGSTCTGEGVCTPGMRRRTSAGCPAGQTRLLECGAMCGYTIEVEPCRATVPVDVLFLPDATPSNWGEFQSQRTSLIARCVDPLLAISDVNVGIAYYGDLSFTPETFVGGVELNTGTSAAISGDILTMTDLGGADDATMEALHILTGGTPQPGAVPFTCSSGRVAGGCWRPGAQRVIVMHTDENARGGPDPSSTALWNPWPTGPSWATVLPRLMTDGTMLFVIIDDGSFGTPAPLAQYREMVGDLGQPMTDVYVEGPTEPGLPPICDSIVARIRAITGT